MTLTDGRPVTVLEAGIAFLLRMTLVNMIGMDGKCGQLWYEAITC